MAAAAGTTATSSSDRIERPSNGAESKASAVSAGRSRRRCRTRHPDHISAITTPNGMAPTAASTSANASDGRTKRRTNSVMATAASATAKAYSQSKDRRRVAAIDTARLATTNTARAAATSSTSAHETVASRPAQPPEMSDRSAVTPTCSSHTDTAVARHAANNRRCPVTIRGRWSRGKRAPR